MRRFLAGCLAVSGLLAAGPATASECGSTSAGWNAPNGAVVFTRGAGPIRDVLDAVGEFRTHSMLSHGTGGGVSHATMDDPAQNGWPTVCGTPLNVNQLQYGYPGLEQVNQGGIYHYMYNPGGTGGPEWSGWQLGDAAGAAQVADSLWYSHPYVSDVSRFDSSQYIDRPLWNGARVPYSLFQYRDSQAVNEMPGSAANNGMVCSTFLAYAHNYAGRGYVPAYTYSHNLIANAANSLYSGINNHCRASLGWFESAALTVICPIFWNVCGNAGNQVANCMTSNRCDTSSSTIWKSVRDNSSTTATSISPDRVGGWGVHPVTTTLWATDYSHQLQWNSGGNVYGCWQ